MYENLEFDAWIHFVRFDDRVLELGQRFDVVILCINHKNKRTTAAKYHIRIEGGLYEVNLTRKIPNLKLYKAGIIDVILNNFACRLEEERLIGRHLVEDDLLYGALAGAPQTHQQYPRFCLAVAGGIRFQVQAILIIGTIAKIFWEWVLWVVFMFVALENAMQENIALNTLLTI